MTEPALKKRKLDPAEATYVFSPLKFSTLKEDLDDVPQAIVRHVQENPTKSDIFVEQLKDALLSIVKNDAKILVELNKAIPAAMANWKKESSEVEVIAEKPPQTDLRSSLGVQSALTAPLVTQYKIDEKLNVEELRSYIRGLFLINPWVSDRDEHEERRRRRRRKSYDSDDDSDDDSSSDSSSSDSDDDDSDESSFDSDEDRENMQENYDELIERLSEKREQAIATFNAGNRIKGYLIFKILSEEANQSRFDRNGDIDEINPRPSPSEWIQLTTALLDDCAAKLTAGEWIGVKAALEKPEEQAYSAENNYFVLSNFPLSRKQVETNFRLSFYKAWDYIGKFVITSATKVEGDRTTFLVKASVPAVSMGGRYKETVTFDASHVINFTCSCPVGNHCKHSAALQAQIAQEKEQLLRVMRQSAMFTP